MSRHHEAHNGNGSVLRRSGAEHDVSPATHVTQESGRRSRLEIAGNHVGVQEEVTSREYDATGRLRYERIERRSYVAPVTSVPADRFAPRQSSPALDAGEEASLCRILTGLALAERVPANGHE